MTPDPRPWKCVEQLFHGNLCSDVSLSQLLEALSPWSSGAGAATSGPRLLPFFTTSHLFISITLKSQATNKRVISPDTVQLLADAVQHSNDHSIDYESERLDDPNFVPPCFTEV